MPRRPVISELNGCRYFSSNVAGSKKLNHTGYHDWIWLSHPICGRFIDTPKKQTSTCFFGLKFGSLLVNHSTFIKICLVYSLQCAHSRRIACTTAAVVRRSRLRNKNSPVELPLATPVLKSINVGCQATFLLVATTGMGRNRLPKWCESGRWERDRLTVPPSDRFEVWNGRSA